MITMWIALMCLLFAAPVYAELLRAPAGWVIQERNVLVDGNGESVDLLFDQPRASIWSCQFYVSHGATIADDPYLLMVIHPSELVWFPVLGARVPSHVSRVRFAKLSPGPDGYSITMLCPDR